jgi:hypothetical protein
MDIYIALSDAPGYKSSVVGAFSVESKAQDACLDDRRQRHPADTLTWEDAIALNNDGSSYDVVLVDLDVPV